MLLFCFAGYSIGRIIDSMNWESMQCNIAISECKMMLASIMPSVGIIDEVNFAIIKIHSLLYNSSSDCPRTSSTFRSVVSFSYIIVLYLRPKVQTFHETSKNYPRNLWSCGDNSCYDQADSNSCWLGLQSDSTQHMAVTILKRRCLSVGAMGVSLFESDCLTNHC